MALWNFSRNFHSGSCPVSNHSVIAEHNISSNLNLVSSWFLCFFYSPIVLILHSIMDCAGHQIIQSLVSCCSHRQQLLCACNFHFCNVVAVGLLVIGGFRSSQVRPPYLFSSNWGLGISILLIVLFLLSTYIWLGDIKCILALCMLWWSGAWSLLLLSSHWFLIQLMQMDTFEWLIYMSLICFGIILLIHLPLHLVLFPLLFPKRIKYKCWNDVLILEFVFVK